MQYRVKDITKQLNKAKSFWLDNSMNQNDRILLLPHGNKRLNLELCEIFEEKLNESYDMHNKDSVNYKAVVLSINMVKTSKFYTVHIISEYLMDSILTLFGMYKFTDKLIIGSLELPYGRKIRNLLTCDIGSEKELMESIIF